MNLTNFTHQQALMVMNELATMQAAHEAEIRAKDEVIEYYRRAAENATRSKHRALHRRSEQRKDIITAAILMVAIGLFFLLTVHATHTAILWASGR